MLKIHHNKVRMTKKRSLAFNAALFHAVKLGLMDVDATIRIVFRKDYQKTHKVMADCVPLENKVIRITLDSSACEHVLMCCTAHEMVHAKQYIMGELGYNKNGDFTWNGKKPKKGTAYHETPWEHEAMTNEVIMAHSFINFIKA